jgi:hypothetical protein
MPQRLDVAPAHADQTSRHTHPKSTPRWGQPQTTPADEGSASAGCFMPADGVVERKARRLTPPLCSGLGVAGWGATLAADWGFHAWTRRRTKATIRRPTTPHGRTDGIVRTQATQRQRRGALFHLRRAQCPRALECLMCGGDSSRSVGLRPTRGPRHAGGFACPMRASGAYPSAWIVTDRR